MTSMEPVGDIVFDSDGDGEAEEENETRAVFDKRGDPVEEMVGLKEALEVGV